MLISKAFVPTLRETPAEAEAVSHVLMLRAGYIRQLASGLYIYLPLGHRVMGRISTIIREEMDAIGAHEITMPALHPAEIWQETGRWTDIGDEMFRLQDRSKRDMCLGMTHEEIITWLASHEIRSYRDLPQVWYQIQTKFRDEARPKSGVLRCREFLMKDSYSFDRNEAGLRETYERHASAYARIFKRCGLKVYQVESDPGMMGGGCAHEFMALSRAGEDTVALCDECGYAANTELAESTPPGQQRTEDGENWDFEDVATPEKRTVDEVAQYLKVNPRFFIKSLLLIGQGGPFLALLRGDQELHEKKLHKIIGSFRTAEKEEVREILGVQAGFIGPHGQEGLRKIADTALRDGIFISGANREGFHTRGIRPLLHFRAEWHDIHVAAEGDSCSRCGARLRLEKAIEIGNIFQLGTKYSVPLKALYLDEEGRQTPIVMGSYGIGPARIAAAAIEHNHDRDGIVWPVPLAPYSVEIIPLNMGDRTVTGTADSLYRSLWEEGIEALMDDRDIRPGVKFKDGDLIGIPLQIIIGEKNLKDGFVELKLRKTREIQRVRPEEIIPVVREKLSQGAVQ